VVAAAVGGAASPSAAEQVTARGNEAVAREAPGTGQAGIAVLRGNDRVQLLGERDGWSEILLSDGRRAWVPTAEIARSGDGPRPTEVPTPVAPAPAPPRQDQAPQELTSEVVRLRALVDELARLLTTLPGPAETRPPVADEIPWAIAAAALIVGFLIGGAWERHRNRRDRSLRF
jgi:hypothetical protein